MEYSNSTYKLLKHMRKCHQLDRTNFSEDALRNLIADKYISTSSDFCDTTVFITDRGRAYVESRFAENFKYFFAIITNSILSLIAISVSIIALLK